MYYSRIIIFILLYLHNEEWRVVVIHSERRWKYIIIIMMAVASNCGAGVMLISI